jgi:hypothetical protein
MIESSSRKEETLLEDKNSLPSKPQTNTKDNTKTQSIEHCAKISQELEQG